MTNENSGRGRLKIFVRDDEVVIRGDDTGLSYLASVCSRIIGKQGPAAHDHLEWQTNDLLEGSNSVVVEYVDGDFDF